MIAGINVFSVSVEMLRVMEQTGRQQVDCWQLTTDIWAAKDEKLSPVLFGDKTRPMIMANARQPMMSYSCLIVTIALSFSVFEILTTYFFQRQGRFGHF